MDKCSHKKDDGTSAIIFDESRFYGINPIRYKGVCILCKSHFEKIIEDGGKVVIKENETH